jgi:tetrahydromethanopterin S-methyltransferase subunit G
MTMAKKNKLTEVSQRIGKALGKADKQAHIHARKLSEAHKVTREELQEISKQVEALKKQLTNTTHRIKKALTA